MGKIKEIIRLYESGLSIKKIAQALVISRPVVSQYIIDYKAIGLKNSATANISNTRLLELLGKKKQESQKYRQIASNFSYYTKELKKNVAAPSSKISNQFLGELLKLKNSYQYTELI